MQSVCDLLMELMEARRIILTQGESLGYVYSSAAHISLR